MNGSNHETRFTDPYLDLEAEAATTEQERSQEAAEELEGYLQPELKLNPQLSWPEGNPDGTVEEEDYRQMLDWRLTGAGFLLDAIADTIDNDADDKEWSELKQAVGAAKAISDPLVKLDYVLEIEKAVYEFTSARGATYDDYVGGRE